MTDRQRCPECGSLQTAPSPTEEEPDRRWCLSCKSDIYPKEEQDAV